MIAGATYTLPLDIKYEFEKLSKVIVTLKNDKTGSKIKKTYPKEYVEECKAEVKSKIEKIQE